MGAILKTIKATTKLSVKEAKHLESALKNSIGEDLDRALTHGFFMRKDNIAEALEIARRTFLTNL